MKIFSLLLLLCGLSCAVQSQTVKEYEFTGLTFLSSPCNGSCPDISMNLYTDKRVEISRTVFSKKGKVDTALSGSFKGSLDQKDFDKLTGLMKAVDWNSVAFPDITCCDGPVVTFMFSYKGAYKKLKSMTPPPATRDLIKYLRELGTKLVLPKYDKKLDFTDF